MSKYISKENLNHIVQEMGKKVNIIDDLTNEELQEIIDSFEPEFVPESDNNFCIIYPNGGTAANPANVVPNSRYVEQNPFSGYHVACIPEVLVSGNWEFPGQFINLHGINASQHRDGEIIITTGGSHLTTSTAGNCGATTDIASVDSLQLRVKVFKIGKVANNA